MIKTKKLLKAQKIYCDIIVYKTIGSVDMNNN